MEYKAILKLQIFSIDRTKVTSGTREVTFPFAPYVGLVITENWNFDYELISVTWSMDENRFYCYIDDQESDDDSSVFSNFIDMAWLVEEAKKYGWSGFSKIVELGKHA
jgi:hypothetical protein